MSNTPHPLDLAVDDLAGTVRRLLVRAFLQPDADGEVRIDPIERMALDAHDEVTGTVLAYRRREVAADSYKRNGATRITRDRFREAGAELVDLAAERRERRSNVVRFPTRQDVG